MEVDLELPFSEHEELHVGLNRSAEVEECTDGMRDEEDDASLARKPVAGSNLIECTSLSEHQFDANIIAGDTFPVETFCEPQNGLEFDSKEAAYSFYREYARSVGFGITIKSSRRSKKSGNFIDVKIACSRFGSKRECNTTVNSRSCPKTDCKAGLHMKRRQDGKWVIYSFVKEHNHKICKDDFYYSVRGQVKQSTVACQKKGLQLVLDKVDVEELFNYFMCIQDEHPNFFYAVDLDSEKRLRSVFWIDAKGRHDYKYFCDVVLFDSFYIKSKYKLPFFPLIGVNHHFQFMLLGCALTGDETESAFIWFMRTWLKAMGGQAPRVILTDQDRYMKEAVVAVFPDARHCFCLWHVLGNTLEHLGDIINHYEKFLPEFNSCIYQSWTDYQFERSWWKMIDRFELRENTWFQSLYDDRKKWVPTYMKDAFFAGMSTSERSGSVASFFDKYLYEETTLTEFIKLQDAYLRERDEMEAKAEYETQKKQSAVKSMLPFEKQMSTLYTDEVFRQFQVEVIGVESCRLQRGCDDHRTNIFQVDDLDQQQIFTVAWNEADMDIRCLCNLFEYRGLLCRHAMVVLKASGVSKVPAHYILKRWTRDAKVRQSVGTVPPSKDRIQRFNDLCKRAIKLGEAGSLSQETYNTALQTFEKILKNCASTNNSNNVSDSDIPGRHGSLNGKVHNPGHCVAKTSKRRIGNRKRKALPGIEESVTGRESNYHESENVNTIAADIENCYVPQQHMQEVEPGSMRQSLDGYYGSPQRIHIEKCLNVVASIEDNYCSSQHGLQEMAHLHSTIPTHVDPYRTQPSLQNLLQGQINFQAPTKQGCYDIQDGLQDIEQPLNSRQFQNTATKEMHDNYSSQ